MDKKTFTIGVLSIISTILVAANLIPTPRAEAATVIKDRSFTLSTTRGQRGGESLYVIDNQTGQIANITITAGQIKVISTSSLANLSTK